MRVLAALALIAALVVGVFAPAPARASAAACQNFPQTGHQVCDAFLAYWQQHGGLAINGYPLTDARTETLEDGRQYTVQWFERVRLEAHPENPAPYDILLGQFGRIIHPADPPQGYQTGTVYYDPAATKATAPIYFPQTGHTAPYDFSVFWVANGGLAQFGYPLSDVFRETLEDGNSYEVQYFERARLERHPEAGAGVILLGQFGRRILAQRGGAAPAPSPSAPPPPAPSSPPPSAPPPAPSPSVAPPPPSAPPSTNPRAGCDPSYPTVCIPPPPPDLNCKDIPYKRFTVLPPDPHNFDSDHDGIGCES